MGISCSNPVKPTALVTTERLKQLKEAQVIIHQSHLIGGHGSSSYARDLLELGGRSGYSDVDIRIYDTFPQDTETYGTVYIHVITCNENDNNTDKNSQCDIEADSDYDDDDDDDAFYKKNGLDTDIILCSGRPHAAVTNELKRKLSIDAIGFTVVYIPGNKPFGIIPKEISDTDKTFRKKREGFLSKIRKNRNIPPRAPHFVGFHKYTDPIHIAWAYEITGLTRDPIRNVPVVWKRSEEIVLVSSFDEMTKQHTKYDSIHNNVDTSEYVFSEQSKPCYVNTLEWKRPATAGGMELVDIRPCLAGFTFWFNDCRATITHMVEISKYEARKLTVQNKKENIRCTDDHQEEEESPYYDLEFLDIDAVSAITQREE